MAAIAAFFNTSDDNGHLKAELQNLRRKGALRPSADWDSTGPDPDRSCGRCRVELGRVINRGAYCRACRLKVCKGCREYSLRTTDWVCTVCHKHMEIQAASGEWMNEFVRRPSRRRDNRVYVPAADIIKRTIRRSWTISNPTPRWSALRGSPELRPYNSLPRGQDINNYPSLINHRANNADHKPCRRTHSEDVYTERPQKPEKPPEPEKPARVNPLMKLGENKRQKSPRRKSQPKVVEEEKKPNEKRVSFDSSVPEPLEKEAIVKNEELHFAKEETAPVELCDIEPLSGTVFRKVTVRRRRQDVRKISTIDTGWRRTSESDLVDILLPDGDDYKLVFLSSDSSSKEEDDSSSTASSFPIDECDWDYFEPGAIRPKEDLAVQCFHPRRNCKNCGASAQFIPIPVPVPVPFPVWTPMSRAALIWPLITGEKVNSNSEDIMPEPRAEEPNCELSGYVECEGSSDSSVDSDEEIHVERVYNVNVSLGRESDDALPSSNITSDEEDPKEEIASSVNSDSGDSSDSDSNDTGTDQKSKRFSKTYVVNKDVSCSSSSNEMTSSDNDTDTELDCTVVLTNVKQLDCDLAISDNNCDSVNVAVCSSPALSDVSAESLDSSESDRVKTPEDFLCNNNNNYEETCTTIRSDGDVVVGGCHSGEEGERAGVIAAPVPTDSDFGASRSNAAKYTSLVMITQEPAPTYQQVSVVTSDTTTLVADNDVIVRHTNHQLQDAMVSDNHNQNDVEEESVTVITGGETLSAFEEGLADDDSWVENLSHDDEDFDSNISDSSGEEVTLTCSATDQEDELRGYHRQAIDFKLHTIVEESCEESEVEQSMPKNQLTTDLEKYFFYRLGDGTNAATREDAFSETSSICSEGPDSLSNSEEQQDDKSESNELASSRLEKYFLHGFMGFRRDSDGSVGSDSEGRPSPEQRRKKLVRARGTGRSHSSSLDNLLANPDLTSNEQNTDVQSENSSSSSDSDTYDESNIGEKSDGQFDTIKRKKANKKNQNKPELETTQEVNENDNASEEDEDRKTPQPEIPSNLTTNKNQQSRDSGFVGSCDDLLKDQKEADTPKHELKIELENIMEERTRTYTPLSTPPATSLTRKDSFNNWSSDEETNLMMCKMRQFFKTMVANSQSKPTTPNLSNRSPKPFPRKRCKPPQLVYFENELTRLMKTVPGLRDDQVREIVEYLSSEDTWSDSYDSSDYTSSDLEGTTNKSALQKEISDSCKQIINKFDGAVDEGEEGDGVESQGLNRETAFVYQKLVASFEKIASGDNINVVAHNSPPLIAKVMHHIGSRLVALMHEVSSGESHASNSPKTRHYHKRLQQKISTTSSTTEDDDSTSDNNLPETLAEVNFNLPRSRSHDLLVGESRVPHSGASDIAEEREVSDCERFSWRGSFESALLADSRNKLSLIGESGSASASALAIAAKRRSAGDLHFKSLSREQLDRVRSCGSIGGANSEDKLWTTRPTRRRSSVPDAACGSGGSADGEEDDEEEGTNRSTLPRSLQSGAATTNSLPRLPTSTGPSMQKAHSMYHFLPPNAKSARYRPPGFNKIATTVPKRAASAPGLQHQRRGRRSQQHNVPSDDVNISEAHSSPMLASRNGSKSATPSPVAPPSSRRTASNQDWPHHHHIEDDIDRLVVMHHTRSSLSSLGLRSDSMASVYSGAGEGRYGTVIVRGQVEFGLQYNYKAGALEISVKQCKDLAPVDAKRNRSDPYVKVYLLPDKSKSGKRKTKVKKHTLNPVFDETLKFQISLNGLETRTLWLTVWHSDMFGRNDFLGEVMMTLENKVFDDPTPKWYNLQERTEPFDDMLSFKGDIIVCLKFVPPDMTVQKKGKRSRGTLHVLVKEAKNLTAVKANGASDPFCKSYLLPDKARSAKQKTPVAKRTVNPVWNFTFVYEDVTLQELTERCLELTVWDHDRLASNEFLGGVRFSLGTGRHCGKNVDWMDATGKEMSLWKSMLERPNFWVEGCLSLRPSLDTRCS